MNELFGFQLTPYVYWAGAEPPVGVWEGGREEVTLPSLENWEKSALNFEEKKCPDYIHLWLKFLA